MAAPQSSAELGDHPLPVPAKARDAVGSIFSWMTVESLAAAAQFTLSCLLLGLVHQKFSEPAR